MTSAEKPKWQVFWDLQCPYSRISWEKLPDIQKHFDDEYMFEIKLTSLLFHQQAFIAQSAACLIQKYKGNEGRLKFIDACFQNQLRYTKATLGDARPSEVHTVFASIAKEAGIFDDESFTEQFFLANIDNYDDAVKPAYSEHKEALQLQIYGVPKHVIGSFGLIPDSESSWGVAEFTDTLSKL